MILNSANLQNLYVGFKTTFQNAFNTATSQYGLVAMTVPSTTKEEKYGWFGQIPRIREFLGDRVVNSLGVHDYAIKNRKWELTVGVNRDDIEDDTYDIYTPMIAEIGRSAATFPDELVWPLLKAGFSTLCYDGQYFFDTDHPVLDADGNPVSVSNSGGGSGEPWFLCDLSRTIKPIVYQNRRAFEFTRMDAATDEVVFNREEYRYGLAGRSNVGFGFWQIAYGSKQPLTHDSYAAARAAMASLKGDYGRPLGLRPTHLITGPALEGTARKILVNETKANGETNEWQGTAEPVATPWLA